jgi:soluble epoxide hydrolase/lipid-phosphate phosphatase
VNWYPKLFTKLAFLDVGYNSPEFGLTEETCKFVNAQVKEHLGYEVFGYFLFFQDEDAAELIENNVSNDQSIFWKSLTKTSWTCWLPFSILKMANLGRSTWGP